MKVIERIGNCGVVPVVVLDKVSDALPTAEALLAGNVDVMEITLRTDAGLESIKEVAEKCPKMCVGAGTVITLEQCKEAVAAGAKFIVAPGFNPEVVKWCMEHDITITPGCVTPTEIMGAMELGVKVFKFFPANVYGGLTAMKALAGPFGDVQFVPTGGVSANNLGEYCEASFIHAVGGTWFCAKSDIGAGEFGKITELSSEARKIVQESR
jgi:2-dehydro-3-deoxyphosphogluconate aldolase/(4S)-4-hydroxy-2-oxoglutarate aldolase